MGVAIGASTEQNLFDYSELFADVTARSAPERKFELLLRLTQDLDLLFQKFADRFENVDVAVFDDTGADASPSWSTAVTMNETDFNGQTSPITDRDVAALACDVARRVAAMKQLIESQLDYIKKTIEQQVTETIHLDQFVRLNFA